MRKVRYLRGISYGLTTNKVYDVIKYDKSDDVVVVIDDFGKSQVWYMVYDNTVYFIDVTSEYRNSVIDGIIE